MANGRHIENVVLVRIFFVLLLHFGLRRAAAFVLSPIHFIYNFEYHTQSKRLKNKINKC